MIYGQLFFSFLQIGLFSIGGGYSAIPLIQSQVVNGYHWLSIAEFSDLITIAEMTPGPIAINAATFVGIRIAGLPGAVIATAGCILPSFVIILALAYFYSKYKNLSLLQNVLGSLRPAVVALIAGAGLSMISLVIWGSNPRSIAYVNWLGIALMLGAFLLIRKLKWHPILVMGLCGAASLAAAIIQGI